jgi:hypothetical protein
LLQRAITQLVDNRTPNVQVGRVELGRIEGALKTSGEVLQRRFRLWVWWVPVYAGILGCAEVAALRWEDIEFGWQRGRLVWVQVKLAVAGWKVFKIHTQAVLLRFSLRDKGPCVVKALADCEAMACLGVKQGLVFTMKTQEVRQVFQRLAGCAATASGVFLVALVEGRGGDRCGKVWLGIVRDYACGSLAVGHGFTIFVEWGTTGSCIGGWRPGSNGVAGFVNTRFGIVLFGHCALCMPMLLYEQWSLGVYLTPPAENSYKGRLYNCVFVT